MLCYVIFYYFSLEILIRPDIYIFFILFIKQNHIQSNLKQIKKHKRSQILSSMNLISNIICRKKSEYSCTSCKIPIDVKLLRPYYPPTDQIVLKEDKQIQNLYCIFCCQKKIDDLSTNKSIEKNGISFSQQLKQFIGQNCVLCGRYCKSKQKIILKENTQLHVGKECYIQLHNNINHPDYENQKRTKQEIDKLVIINCLECNKKKINQITAPLYLKQYNLCSDKCLLSSKQNANQIYDQSQRKCSKCSQKDVFENNWIRIGSKKKQLWIRQFYKDIKNSNNVEIYCSFCLYQQYLNLQKKYQNKQIDEPSVYFELKKTYQLHFMNYCMVCARWVTKKKQKSKEQVCPIKSQFQNSIWSYLCQTCSRSIYNKCQMKNFYSPGLSEFFKQTDKFKQSKYSTLTIEQFQKKCKQSFKSFKKIDLFQSARLEQNQINDCSDKNDKTPNNQQAKDQSQNKYEQLLTKLIQYPRIPMKQAQPNEKLDTKKLCETIYKQIKKCSEKTLIKEILSIMAKDQSQTQNEHKRQTISFDLQKSLVEKKCHFKQCQNKQMILNLNQTMCDKCFVQYLLGIKQFDRQGLISQGYIQNSK